MSLLTWLKNKVSSDFDAAYANVKDLVGAYAGPIEVAMATQAKAEFPALTAALWASIQGAAQTAVAQVENLAESGDLKWSTAMNTLEAFLSSVGGTTFSTTTKETLLQTATDIVKAGLFAGLTAAGVPSPASSAAQPATASQAAS